MKYFKLCDIYSILKDITGCQLRFEKPEYLRGESPSWDLLLQEKAQISVHLWIEFRGVHNLKIIEIDPRYKEKQISELRLKNTILNIFPQQERVKIENILEKNLDLCFRNR